MIELEGKIIAVDRDLKANCVLAVLQCHGEPFFVIRDYRMDEPYVVGEDKNVPDLVQVDDFVNDKGTAFKCYSNEEKTSDAADKDRCGCVDASDQIRRGPRSHRVAFRFSREPRLFTQGARISACHRAGRRTGCPHGYTLRS